jgi:peptide/nickel transport system ATP-binding protein
MSQIQLSKEILSIRNLSVKFVKESGTIRKKTTVINAVNNVSLDLPESEIISIVGESGSGKTTVARCIMKLQEPTTGSISYRGIDINKLKGRELLNFRRDVQMVFQDPYESLNPRQDVLSTISGPVKNLRGEKNSSKVKEIAIGLLEEVGLRPDKFLHRLPHQLSGGERQRVNIARALASNPKMLVADEPITMLDAAQRFNVLNLIKSLKEKRNLTVLLITHDLASVKILKGKTYVMYLGRLVEGGSSNEVLSKPHHPYVELIRESTPVIRRTNLLVEGSESDAKEIATMEESAAIKEGCVFRPRCKYATAICAGVDPQLQEKSSGHVAACHNPLNMS